MPRPKSAVLSPEDKKAVLMDVKNHIKMTKLAIKDQHTDLKNGAKELAVHGKMVARNAKATEKEIARLGKLLAKAEKEYAALTA